MREKPLTFKEICERVYWRDNIGMQISLDEYIKKKEKELDITFKSNIKKFLGKHFSWGAYINGD